MLDCVWLKAAVRAPLKLAQLLTEKVFKLATVRGQLITLAQLTFATVVIIKMATFAKAILAAVSVLTEPARKLGMVAVMALVF